MGGESLLWLRVFPALTSIGALIPFWFLCRKLRLGVAETNLALLLLAVNGYLIKYAQDVRMYSLLLFLSVCSLWLFVRFFKASTGARKQLIILSIVNLLLIYTHYYGWLVVAGELSIVLIWQRQKLLDLFIATAVLLLAFSPWVYAVASISGRGDLMQNIGWIARPRLSDITQFFILLNEPFYFRQSSVEPLYYRGSALLGFLLLTVPILVMLWKTYRQRHAPGAVQWLFVFSAIVIGLAFLLSWIFPYSVWGTRHLIILAVPYAVLAAIALNRLQPYWLKTTVVLIFGCWLFLAGTIFLLPRPATFIWCAWEQLAQQIAQQPRSAAPIKIYAFEDLIAYHLWFALQEQDRNRFSVAVIKRVPGVEEDPAYFLPRGFSDIATVDLAKFDEAESWIAFRDFTWDENRPPLKTLSERGYKVGNVLEVSLGGQRAFLVRISQN
ncbi:MAG TPA: hypothetical protein VJM12_14845 [Pyrinomonadaceae bacterium]|nr:hypothetical protein [Pyrinomonadaceae bacterium]